MPILSSELIGYGAANMVDDDVSTVGGAIDTAVRFAYTDIAANDDVEIVSDNAGDTTQTVTVYGRNTAGELVNEPLSLNGLTVVTGSQVFERITRIVVSAAHTGTITVRRQPGGADIALLEPGVNEVRKLFQNSASDQSSLVRYYEKVFMRNTNGSLTLNAAQLQLNEGVIERSNTAQAGAATTITLDASASAVDDYYNETYIKTTGGTGSGQFKRITDYDGTTKVATVDSAWSTNPDATTTFEIHALVVNIEDAKDDNNSAANRLTAPTGNDGGGWRVPGEDINLPGTTLAASEGIGVWVQLIRPPQSAPAKEDFTLRLLGTTV